MDRVEAEIYELSLHNKGLRSMLGLSKCVRLRVLAAARQWLSTTEQVPLAGECGTTPKTLRHHRDSRRSCFATRSARRDWG